MKKKLLIMICNHFDLAWRRAFKRRIENKGKTYISYSDIHDFYMEDNMRLCRENPGYRFNIESVVILREYLRRHPEKFAEIRRLFDEKRCYIPMSGDNIIDVNLVQGETIVRNFLYGTLWTEDNFGYTPILAVRNDAFGNSAQLPQILRKCGIKWVNGLAYSPCKNQYWRGLDGSTVFCGNLPTVGSGGSWKKYPPCQKCCGTGKIEGSLCNACNGRGIDRNIEKAVGIFINAADFGNNDTGIIRFESEEIIPGEKITEWADKQKNDYEVSFAALEDSYPYIEKLLNDIDNEKDIHSSFELNPNNTGCYTTRIKVKQHLRKDENALLALETLSSMLYTKTGFYPAKSIGGLWEKILYNSFHDMVTAEHMDFVYEDIQKLWEEFDEAFSGTYKEVLTHSPSDNTRNAVTVINTTGQTAAGIAEYISDTGDNLAFYNENGTEAKLLERSGNTYRILIKDMPPYSSQVLLYKSSGKEHISAADNSNKTLGSEYSNVLQGQQQNAAKQRGGASVSIENERYLIDADNNGLLSVYDKLIKKTVSKAGIYRPGELIYEHDEGSPWATLSPDTSCVPASTSLEEIEKNENYQRLKFKTAIGITASYSIEAFCADWTVTLYKGIKEIRYETSIRWDDFNHRVRVAFPVCTDGNECRHLYGIPYGFIERKPYEPVHYWAGSNGDWPAIDWAGIETKDAGIAVFNKGIPSYKIEKTQNKEDVIYLSLLRSPTIPTYLHEPMSYSLTEWDTMRDAGSHFFEYALASYNAPLPESNVVCDAELYNKGFCIINGKTDIPELPFTASSENIRITSIKKAEKDNGLIIRMAEYRGKAGKIAFTLSNAVKAAYIVNLLEKTETRLDISGGKFEIQAKAFEILSVKISMQVSGKNMESQQ